MPEIDMPRMSDTMEEGRIVRWLKQVGDRVEKGDKLAEVETDKAVMELDSYLAGTLEKQLLGEGESALLIVEEQHELQFPPEVEVFYVAPPALDELHRWLRDRQRAQAAQQGGTGQGAAESAAGGEGGASESSE